MPQARDSDATYTPILNLGDPTNAGKIGNLRRWRTPKFISASHHISFASKQEEKALAYENALTNMLNFACGANLEAYHILATEFTVTRPNFFARTIQGKRATTTCTLLVQFYTTPKLVKNSGPLSPAS